ncbi:MAG: isoprenylcysteine carboxylmethyltransferase family protein, partial [Pseudomonadota bacterium]
MFKPVLPPPVWALIFLIGGYLVTEPFEVGMLDYGQAFAVELALLFVAAGFLLPLVAVRQFRKHQTTVLPMNPGNASSLVTDGVYQVTRNPMYVGMLLVLLGFSFLGHNYLGFVMPALFMLVITVTQILPEERALEENFGDQFLAYKKT